MKCNAWVVCPPTPPVPRFQARAIRKCSTNSRQSCYIRGGRGEWRGEKTPVPPESPGRGEPAGTALASGEPGCWAQRWGSTGAWSTNGNGAAGPWWSRGGQFWWEQTQSITSLQKRCCHTGWAQPTPEALLKQRISHQRSRHGSNLLIAPWHLNLQMTIISYCLTSTNVAIQRLLGTCAEPTIGLVLKLHQAKLILLVPQRR